jgi:alpha-L-fucosidase 2
MMTLRLNPLISKALSFMPALLLLASCGRSEHRLVQPDMHLWYGQPAVEWVEALPVGNGRLGAMVFGHPFSERIQLNEESIWAGSPLNNNNPEALQHLPLLRQLLFDYRVDQAQEMVARHFIGNPPRIRSYQTAGDLLLTSDSLAPWSGYRRSLCLETGIAMVRYTAGNTEYTREVFSSSPANAIIVRVRSSKKGSINLTIDLTREKDAVTESLPDGVLVMRGQIIDYDDPLRGPGGSHMKFAAAVKAIVDEGEIVPGNGRLTVKDAGELILIYSAVTNYDPDNLGFRAGADPADETMAIIRALEGVSFRKIKAEHIDDHSGFFNRVTLDLGGKEKVSVPTDRRLAMVKDGEKDPHMAAILFQYGRYLLMGSSRAPGVLPANLQGIWNEHFDAPWNSDFHTNINLQMNYWPAEITNLPETLEPLSRFMMKLTGPGSITAREMYDADGWTFHHLTDPFGRTGVMDGPWGLTPMCGPWMTFPVWRHYSYSLDAAYLREYAWPLLRGSALFILDFLVEGPSGYLVTNPSHSPENTYFLPGTGNPVTLTYGASMDIQIAGEVLENTIEAAELLGEDPELIRKCREALAKLPPLQVGQDGTIMEWIEDYSEPDPGHRHISHLLGLYPLHRIGPDDPRLLEAAAKTIEKRLQHGGGHTGWSRAWTINFFNRLRNSEKAYENLMVSLEQTTLKNLFSTHPPFQIDGNFGTTAGIAGMLLGSAPGHIDILPALPDAWARGSVEGLRAHGGLTVSINWEDGTLKSARIEASKPVTVNIRFRGQQAGWTAGEGDYIIFDNRLDITESSFRGDEILILERLDIL